MTRPFILPLAMMVGSCGPEGVNSASAAHACHVASQAGAALDILARDLAAAGFSTAKINAVLPLIQAGKLLVDVNCALLVPSAG